MNAGWVRALYIGYLVWCRFNQQNRNISVLIIIIIIIIIVVIITIIIIIVKQTAN